MCISYKHYNYPGIWIEDEKVNYGLYTLWWIIRSRLKPGEYYLMTFTVPVKIRVKKIMVIAEIADVVSIIIGTNSREENDCNGAKKSNEGK